MLVLSKSHGSVADLGGHGKERIRVLESLLQLLLNLLHFASKKELETSELGTM
jgi:hypothetical protein